MEQPGRIRRAECSSGSPSQRESTATICSASRSDPKKSSSYPDPHSSQTDRAPSISASTSRDRTNQPSSKASSASPDSSPDAAKLRQSKPEAGHGTPDSSRLLCRARSPHASIWLRLPARRSELVGVGQTSENVHWLQRELLEALACLYFTRLLDNRDFLVRQSVQLIDQPVDLPIRRLDLLIDNVSVVRSSHGIKVQF